MEDKVNNNLYLWSLVFAIFVGEFVCIQFSHTSPIIICVIAWYGYFCGSKQ